MPRSIPPELKNFIQEWISSREQNGEVDAAVIITDMLFAALSVSVMSEGSVSGGRKKFIATLRDIADALEKETHTVQ